MDAMRSLLTLDALVGLGTIIVVHHTGSLSLTFYHRLLFRNVGTA